MSVLIKPALIAACAAVLLGIGVTMASSAESPAPAPAVTPAATVDPSANAALDWWRAFDLVPKSSSFWDDVVSVDDDGQPTPDAWAAADVVFPKPLIFLDLFAQGAARPLCDWGIDVAHEGAGAPLPQLTHLRDLVRLVCLRARWHARRGEAAAAVDDLSLALRASAMCAGRRPTLSQQCFAGYLVGKSLIVAGIIAERLDDGARRRLARTCDELPLPTVADTIDVDTELMMGEVARLRAMPLAERLRWARDNRLITDADEATTGAALVGDDALDGFVTVVPAQMERWSREARRPLAERAGVAVATQSLGGNAMVRLLMPMYPLAFASEARLAIKRAQLLAALAWLDGGDAALAEHPDPISGETFTRTPTGGTSFHIVTGSHVGGVLTPMELAVGEDAPPVPSPEDRPDFRS